ncbi:MAG: hypothetical protein NZ553_03085 [Caldilinea sp.]|nr:hypothetical protein [Caldilinea sp.]MDW8439435.1 hypothetical protein [Caldilineaceae bacterium]
MSDSIAFEEEFRKFLRQRHARFIDQTRSYHDADFALMLSDGARFALEVKEKRQPYAASAWPTSTPEPHMFILDDLTVRKCLGFAPRAGVAIKDIVGKRYVFFSVIDLALMPRVRVNRRIERNRPDLKGKWIVDLRNGGQAATLEELLGHIQNYLANLHSILYEFHPCYGDYVGETVGDGGITRRPEHWTHDVRNSRGNAG